MKNNKVLEFGGASRFGSHVNRQSGQTAEAALLEVANWHGVKSGMGWKPGHDDIATIAHTSIEWERKIAACSPAAYRAA